MSFCRNVNHIVVLFAVDSSNQAEWAFDWYIENIHQTGNILVVLHSLDLDKVDDDDQFGSQSSLRLWDQNRGRIKAIDNKYRWKLNENRLPGKIRTEAGNPSDVILQVAREENAGLIVIGSRGLSKFKTTLFGSVSDYVLHHSKCPVLICRRDDKEVVKTPKV